MRMRYLFHAGLLAAALFASSMSFAAAHGPGATFDAFHLAANETSATTAVMSTKEVPSGASGWVASASAKFATTGANLPAIDVAQKFVVVSAPGAGNDGGGGQSTVVVQSAQSQASNNSPALRGMFDQQVTDVYHIAIVGRTNLTIATASAQEVSAGTPASLFIVGKTLAPTGDDALTAVVNAGFPRVDSGSVTFSTASMLMVDQSSPQFAGMQRTEHIASAAAAKFGHLQSADVKKEASA